MRKLGALVALIVGCAAPVPVGVYRMPIQTGQKSVTLKTFLVRQEDADLVLYDASDGREFAHGATRFDWSGSPLPYQMSSGAYPFSFYLRDGVIEEAGTPPFATIPDPPLAPKGTSVTRVTLVSGSDSVVLDSVNGYLFADAAHRQPALSETAGPLAILDSFSGGGLFLPADPTRASTWHDALSTAVPPDATKPLECASPLVSSYRVVGLEAVDVPAGHFQALHLNEVIDSCLRLSPTDVKVYLVDRWLASGVGPVQLSYQASDGRVREYRLVRADVRPGSTALWPLDAGDSWTFEVRDPSGAVVDPGAVVKVQSARQVTFP